MPGRQAGAGKSPRPIERALAEAVRLWRVAHQGRLPPGVEEQGARRWQRTLLDHLHAVLDAPEVRIRAVAERCAERGEQALRLAVDGAGGLRLYTGMPEEEHCMVLGAHCWVRCERLSLDLRRRGRPTVTWLARRPLDEVILHDWPAAETWALEAPPELTCEQALGLADELARAAEDCPEGIRPALPESAFPGFIADYRAFALSGRGATVNTPGTRSPLASCTPPRRPGLHGHG